ncbi:MAG: hypothetical protein AAFR18_21530 [Cyanobacteria bacterium J06627_32]
MAGFCTSRGHTPSLLELEDFFLNTASTEQALDAIEISFLLIDRLTRDPDYLGRQNASAIASDAIEELNIRFKEHGVGYQFIDDKILRVDSELLHVEAVKPALRLLNVPHYEGAQEEFLSAYDHYRHGNNKEAITDCLKAFESTMKAICDKRGWTYSKNDTAKKLIKACFDNDLIPSFWQNQFSSLQKLLEGSIPTVRNKLGGHGQGSIPVNVPAHLVAYTLHMTASTLVFLAKAEKELG